MLEKNMRNSHEFTIIFLKKCVENNENGELEFLNLISDSLISSF
jgi:hypothetical protein